MHTESRIGHRTGCFAAIAVICSWKQCPGPEFEADFDGPDRPTVKVTRVYIMAR